MYELQISLITALSFINLFSDNFATGVSLINDTFWTSVAV